MGKKLGVIAWDRTDCETPTWWVGPIDWTPSLETFEGTECQLYDLCKICNSYGIIIAGMAVREDAFQEKPVKDELYEVNEDSIFWMDSDELRYVGTVKPEVEG